MTTTTKMETTEEEEEEATKNNKSFSRVNELHSMFEDSLTDVLRSEDDWGAFINNSILCVFL